MQKIISFFSAIVLVIAILAGTASAADVTSVRVDFSDGSYAVVTTISHGMTRASVNDSKVYTYYDENGDRCFAYTLYATFQYDGRTSSAADVDYTVRISQRGWDISSHSEWTSGDTAYGRAVFTDPDGGRHSVSLSLTCDEDGNVS